MGASSDGAVLEIPPFVILMSNRHPETGCETAYGGQFDWGGRLPKSNGGARRYAQRGRTSRTVCNGISVLDCKIDGSSRYESRS